MKKFTLSLRSAKNFGLSLSGLLFYAALSAQIVQTQSFDAVTFPPPGWAQGGGNLTYLFRDTAGIDPTQRPHSGAGEVEFDSYDLPGGTTLLISPLIDWSNRGIDTPTISFWFYRDSLYNMVAFDSEGVTLLVNTSPTDAGGTPLIFVPRPVGAAPVVVSPGWYQYTVQVPNTFNTSANYFVFQFNSLDGDNCYLDDVQWAPYPTSCTGMPAPGNIIASLDSVCAGTQVNFSLQNSLPSLGTTYQWQFSANNITWANLAGDTLSTISGDTINALTYFRCITGCTLSGLSDTTPVWTETTGSTTCYCVPPPSDCNFGDVISNVQFAGINNMTPNCVNTNGYEAYNLTATVSKEVTYPIDVAVTDGGIENPAVWIDYNHNGIYEDSEFTAIGSGQGGVTFTNYIYIPGTALTGVTGMRVRDQYFTALSGTDACSSIFEGETQDYWVNILPPPVCTDPPVAGTITGDTAVCPGTTSNIILSGQTLGTGIQWQSSADSLSWINVSSPQGITYTTPPLFAKTFVRARITCADTAYTNVLTIRINAFNQCYCGEPAIGGNGFCPGSYVITSVSISGTTLNTGNVCNLNNGYDYTLFPPVGDSTASLYPTISYSINVACSNSFGGLAGWIDFNQDGMYDASEKILLIPNTTGAVQSATFVVPFTALPGQTGMRIRSSDFTMSDSDACTNEFSGETEDYVISIVPLPPCTDPPVAGAIQGISNVCPGDSEILTLVGATLGTSFQWQYSIDSITWHNLPGAVNSVLATSAIHDSAFLRVRVNCTDTVYTPGFGIHVNPWYTCYCSEPGIGGDMVCPSFYAIDTFSITGTPLYTTNVCTLTGGYTYTQFPDTGSSTATVYHSYPYQFNVSCASAGAGVEAWIDFDHSGSYDAGEEVFNYQNTTGAVQSAVFIIPNTSLYGPTGLRVRSNSYGLQTTDACSDEFDGQTFDYIINIDSLPACTMPPVAGTISGSNSMCAGNSTQLLLSGETIGTQVQWQVSTDSLTWTDVLGSRFETYSPAPAVSPTFYRAKITCTDTSVFTDAFKITLNPFYLCYCIPASSDCTFGDEITNVTFAGINNTTGCSTNGYSQYPSPVATVARGSAPTMFVTVGGGGEEYAGVWIDFNQNGVFDSSEFTPFAPAFGGTVTATVVIPNTALSGITGMRVQVEEGGSPVNTEACTSPVFGETEDYLVDITAIQPCTTASVGGTVNGPLTGTAGAGYYYFDIGSVGTVQWQYSGSSAGGPFVSIPAVSSDTLFYSFLLPGTYWVRAYVQSGGCPPDSSNVIQTVIVFGGDSVCNAIPIYFAPTVPLGVNGPFNTAAAIVQTGEPAPPASGCNAQTGWCNSTLNNTMWFTFTAPASGRIRVQTPGFDTKLAVWSAPDCDTILHGGATLLAANDDDPDYGVHGGVIFSSYIDSVICLKPGATYYVQLGATSAPGGTTPVILVDLGNGPDAGFALATAYCINAAPVTLSSDTPGAVFSGTGVTGADFNPATAGVGGPDTITSSFYACYNAYHITNVGSAITVSVSRATDVTCAGASTGAIQINVTGGEGVYTYNWSNGVHAQNIAGVPAGSYSVLVTDTFGCSASSGAILISQQDSAIVVSSSVTNQYQGGAAGTISLTTTGGTSPYHYLWNNSDTTSHPGNLVAEIYTCTITDAFGCSIIVSDTVKFVTGIDNLGNLLALNIFPNPARSEVFIDIQAEKAGDVLVQVYDVEGRLVTESTQRNVLSARIELNFEKEASGVYTARIKVGNAIITRRIVIEK